jgi:hypothetical protein
MVPQKWKFFFEKDLAFWGLGILYDRDTQSAGLIVGPYTFGVEWGLDRW